MIATPPGVVLVVDDSKEDRDFLSSLLSNSGYETLMAAGGAECLDLIDRLRDEGILLNAIFLDLVMPVLNGFEVLQEIRKIPEQDSVPVIILSPYPHTEQCCECLARGANSVLEKPVNRDALLAVINAVPERSKTNWRS